MWCLTFADSLYVDLGFAGDQGLKGLDWWRDSVYIVASDSVFCTPFNTDSHLRSETTKGGGLASVNPPLLFR